MIICHTFETWREAKYYFSEFVEKYKNDLVKATSSNLVAVDKSGNRHYFMTLEEHNRKWCYGRTYIRDGKKYHSGYEVESER